MTQVTINDAPSTQIIANAIKETEVTDAAGRLIRLRKPGVLAQYRLVEMVGQSASNQVYMGMCMPLLFVVAIDGEDVPPPMKKSELEALIQQLDDHGIAAVVQTVAEVFGASDPEADKAAIKKSQQPHQ